MFLDGDSGIKLFDVGYGWRIKVVPYQRRGPEKYISYFSDGEWVYEKLEPGMCLDEKKHFWLSDEMAKDLYAELRKRYDPKDTVSVDAVEMQGRHLEDMRKIVFKNLRIE